MSDVESYHCVVDAGGGVDAADHDVVRERFRTESSQQGVHRGFVEAVMGPLRHQMVPRVRLDFVVDPGAPGPLHHIGIHPVHRDLRGGSVPQRLYIYDRDCEWPSPFEETPDIGQCLRDAGPDIHCAIGFAEIILHVNDDYHARSRIEFYGLWSYGRDLDQSGWCRFGLSNRIFDP